MTRKDAFDVLNARQTACQFTSKVNWQALAEENSFVEDAEDAAACESVAAVVRMLFPELAAWSSSVALAYAWANYCYDCRALTTREAPTRRDPYFLVYLRLFESQAKPSLPGREWLSPAAEEAAAAELAATTVADI